MPGIYSFQIDAYSAVWIDCSINQMLEFYRLKKLFSGFWSDAVPSFSDMVYGQVVRMCYNDILLTFSQYDYDSALRAVEGDCFRLPDCHFRKIQISMMGKALDYMRSNFIDVDSAQSVFRADDPHMHVTRVDFAFDFVNYDLQKDIFDAFDRFTTDGCGLSSSGRLLVRGRPSGLTFQKKYGSSMTSTWNVRRLIMDSSQILGGVILLMSTGGRAASFKRAKILPLKCFMLPTIARMRCLKRFQISIRFTARLMIAISASLSTSLPRSR